MESTSAGSRDIPCSQPKLALPWKHITYHNNTAISMRIYQCLQATNWGNFREKQGIWRKNRESSIKTQPLGRYQMESTNLLLRKRHVFSQYALAYPAKLGTGYKEHPRAHSCDQEFRATGDQKWHCCHLVIFELKRRCCKSWRVTLA